jgi:hypothetical protein
VLGYAVGMQFWRGFLAAILVIEMSMLALVFIRFVPEFRRLMTDFGEARLPWLYTVVTTTQWAIGCSAGLVALALAADRLTRTPKSGLVALALVAVMGAVLLAVTLVGLYAPIFELSGNIEPL